MDISLDMDDETLLMRITDDGIGIPAGPFDGSHGLAEKNSYAASTASSIQPRRIDFCSTERSSSKG